MMADAVNTAFKDDFAKLPKAVADAAKAGAGFTIVKNRTIRVGNQTVPGLDAPLPDEQFLVWGNTDTGLEFFTSFAGLDEAAVAEPSTLVLAMLALLLLIRANGGRRAWQPTGSGFQLKPG